MQVPELLIKVVSKETWEKSQTREVLAAEALDIKDNYIHLSTIEQVDRVILKFWQEKEYVLLYLNPEKLKGTLKYESNSSGTSKYFHLYDGNIPLSSIHKIIPTRLNFTALLNQRVDQPLDNPVDNPNLEQGFVEKEPSNSLEELESFLVRLQKLNLPFFSFLKHTVIKVEEENQTQKEIRIGKIFHSLRIFITDNFPRYQYEEIITKYSPVHIFRYICLNTKKQEEYDSAIYKFVLKITKRQIFKLQYAQVWLKNPYNIQALKTVTELAMVSSKLSMVPEGLFLLLNLSILNFYNNNIFFIPFEIGKLIHLKRLNFSNNRIKEIPTSLSKLIKLTQLNLSENNIDKLPEEMAKLENLHFLDLSFNNIEEITPLCALTKLIGLNLSDNCLSSLPDSVCNLKKLYEFDISNNEIPSIPVNVYKFLKGIKNFEFGIRKDEETF